MEKQNTRRDFLFKSLLAGIGISVLRKKAMANENDADNDFAAMNFQQTSSPYSLSALPYPYDALEPHIDRQTMEIHHTKHHQAYVTNLNKALESVKDAPATLEELLKNISKYPAAVRNNAGGHWNHTFFWTCMRPGYSIAKATAPAGKLVEAINSAFGSFEKFKEQFNDAAKSRFGSGWAWLVVQNGKLAIGSTPNQDNPLMDVSDVKGTPVLALDVWEHAYYLKYQNKRPDYITAWWNVVNWEKAGEIFEKSK